MRILLASLFLVLAVGGCASLEQRANGAAVADGVTTLAGAGVGLAELNPLGLATVALKVPLLVYIKTLPDDEQAQWHALAGPIWGGATVSNLCMIAAVLTAGTFAPVCLAAGIGYGWQQWGASAAERDFFSKCGEYRRVSGEAFRCVYRLAGL